MLQVGSSLLSEEESRTHFAAWCVSSAPLILGYNLADPDSVSRASPFVTNKAAIAINQVSYPHANDPCSAVGRVNAVDALRLHALYATAIIALTLLARACVCRLGTGTLDAL